MKQATTYAFIVLMPFGLAACCVSSPASTTKPKGIHIETEEGALIDGVSVPSDAAETVRTGRPEPIWHYDQVAVAVRGGAGWAKTQPWLERGMERGSSACAIHALEWSHDAGEPSFVDWRKKVAASLRAGVLFRRGPQMEAVGDVALSLAQAYEQAPADHGEALDFYLIACKHGAISRTELRNRAAQYENAAERDRMVRALEQLGDKEK